MPTLDTLDPLAVAALIEGNETDAYRSLFRVGQRLHGADRFRWIDASGVTAFICPEVALPGAFNRIMGMGIQEPITKEALGQALGFYDDTGCSPAIELVHAAKSDSVAAVMKSFRVRRSGVAAVVCHQSPSARERDRQGISVSVARGGDGSVVAAICAKVFGMASGIQSVLSALADEPDWFAFLVRVEEQPAGAGLVRLSGSHAWFGWAATLPEFRGRGVKSALDDARISHAFNHGCTLVTSETAAGSEEHPDHSLKSFTRIGFERAYLRDTLMRPKPLGTGPNPG